NHVFHIPPFPPHGAVDPQDDHEVDHHLWAYLIPLGKNPKILRMDFWRISATAKLGRDPSRNTLILPGPHISATHAEISWNGRNGSNSVISLKDMSSGGTWVSGQLVGRDNSRRLQDGDEIGLGAPVAVDEHGGLYDYRYRFCDVSVKQPPRRLDNFYTYGACLGSGTGGSVRLATEKKSLKVVAIKTIKYITVMERVRHPHILRIFSAHHAETEPSILRPRNLWPDGPSPRGLPENICREIMYQLCHALASLHALGITHRDLKPEATFRVEMKSLCGTIGYAAPEVLDKTQPGYNYLADSFSAGVMMFSMLILIDPWFQTGALPQSPLPEMHWKYLTTQLLSPPGLLCLKALLQVDPKKRLSPAGALNHPWLKTHQPMHHKLDGPYMEA
ncbi:kinase-like domain-containing protein, partial [Mycena leptocephala]